MHESTVERMAEAVLYELMGDCDPDAATPGWQEARNIVRAALGAMRIDDPLSPILEAGRCTTDNWNRMIEAALAEVGRDRAR